MTGAFYRFFGLIALALLLVLAACAPARQAPPATPPSQATPAPTAPPPGTAPPVDMSVPELPPPALPPAPPSKARIALLLPLSGEHKAVGQALLNAAQLALFNFPEAPIVLLPRDTTGTPSGAAQAAREAIAAEADFVIGPLFAAEVRAAAPIIRQAGRNLLALSNDRQVAGSGVFVFGFLPEQEVSRIVSFAAERGVRRFAALIPQTPYGGRVADALRPAVQAAGAALVRLEPYRPETMARSVTALADARESTPFDALLLPEGGALLGALAPLVVQNGMGPPVTRLLGTGLWNDPELQSVPALMGGWFAAPPPQGFERFARDYMASFGERPVRIVSLGYDAMALAVVLAKRPGPDRFSVAALTEADGFAGVDGLFRLLPNGLPDRRLAVLAVQPGGFVVVSPADRAFIVASGQEFGKDRVENEAPAGGGAQPVAAAGQQPVRDQPGQRALVR